MFVEHHLPRVYIASIYTKCDMISHADPSYTCIK